MSISNVLDLISFRSGKDTLDSYSVVFLEEHSALDVRPKRAGIVETEIVSFVDYWSVSVVAG